MSRASEVCRMSAAVALALVGCVGMDTPAEPGPPDLAPADLATPPDLTRVEDHRSLTGAPCTAAVECKPSTSGTKAGVCTKTSMFQMANVSWPDGYCQSPCLLKNADPKTGLSSDCPGDATTCLLTSQTGGLCVQACVASIDCRDGYVCAQITGTLAAGCVPLKSSACDPPGDASPQGLHCGAGQHCMAFSPDNSWGQCATDCHPLLQDCPSQEDDCAVDRKDPNGGGTCIGFFNRHAGPEGAACAYANDCYPSLVCEQNRCRRYCKAGGAPCPRATPRCVDLAGAAFDASVLGACVP